MNVLLVNASPHPHGNTALALSEMETVFAAAGVHTDVLRIGSSAIRGCIACGTCSARGRCVFEDEGNQAAPLFEAADGLVLATPVYYASANATLIAFLDSRGDAIRKATTVLASGSTTPEGDEIYAGCANPYYNGKVYVPSRYNTRSFNAYALDHNMRLIRYAEVLLIYAEAMASGAAITPVSGYTADMALNEVRARAGLPATTATLPHIYDERRAELALEENRFFDLVRWGKAAEVLGPLGFTAGKNELFPVPANQRQLNPKLPQTPGYTY